MPGPVDTTHHGEPVSRENHASWPPMLILTSYSRFAHVGSVVFRGIVSPFGEDTVGWGRLGETGASPASAYDALQKETPLKRRAATAGAITPRVIISLVLVVSNCIFLLLEGGREREKVAIYLYAVFYTYASICIIMQMCNIL